MLHKILMVEDETDIQHIARVALEVVGGFEVEMCSGGVEALEKAALFAPDMIVLDVMMPVMDGPMTLAHLREIDGLQQTPIVFMTAKAQPDEVESYRALGASVISKPFDPMTLATDLRAIYERSCS
jgi:CheY-like chemotaxis protein